MYMNIENIWMKKVEEKIFFHYDIGEKCEKIVCNKNI